MMRRSSGALFAVLSFLLLAPAGRAEYAVLRSGQRLHVTGVERLEGAVRLHIPGGSVVLPAGELLLVEPEENFHPEEHAKLSVPYAEQIRLAAQTHGVDEYLIAGVIAVESNFQRRAVSRKSARGLMQLMPATATRLAVRDVFDPQQNIDAGTRYLKELLVRYNQNLSLALAAYNAGPAAVDLYRGVPPFPETRQYVSRVMSTFQTNLDSATVAALTVTPR